MGSLVVIVIVIAVLVYIFKKKSNKVAQSNEGEDEGEGKGEFKRIAKSTVTISHGSHNGDNEAPTDVDRPSTPHSDRVVTPVNRLA